MNFNEAVAIVVQRAERPDKTTSVQRGINQAINFCCVEGTFARDFEEQIIPLDNTLYAQSFALNLMTRWRKFQYIRPSNRMKYLRPLDSDKIFQPVGKQQCDVYYVAGAEVKINMGTLADELLVGYFQYPPILSGVQEFWLLDISPWMIIDYATSLLYTEVGNLQEANRHMELFRVAFVSACRDYKYGVNVG